MWRASLFLSIFLSRNFQPPIFIPYWEAIVCSLDSKDQVLLIMSSKWIQMIAMIYNYFIIVSSLFIRSIIPKTSAIISKGVPHWHKMIGLYLFYLESLKATTSANQMRMDWTGDDKYFSQFLNTIQSLVRQFNGKGMKEHISRGSNHMLLCSSSFSNPTLFIANSFVSIEIQKIYLFLF